MKNSKKFMEALTKAAEKYPSYNFYIKPLLKNFGATNVTVNFRRKSDKIDFWDWNGYWEDIIEDIPTKVIEKLKEIQKIENFNEFAYQITYNTTEFFDLNKTANTDVYTGYIQKNFEEFAIRFCLDHTYNREDYICNVDIVIIKDSREIWRKRLSTEAGKAPFFKKVAEHLKSSANSIKWVRKETIHIINQEKLDAEFEKLIG